VNLDRNGWFPGGVKIASGVARSYHKFENQIVQNILGNFDEFWIFDVLHHCEIIQELSSTDFRVSDLNQDDVCFNFRNTYVHGVSKFANSEIRAW
jgi:hypothetical protein